MDALTASFATKRTKYVYFHQIDDRCRLKMICFAVKYYNFFIRIGTADVTNTRYDEKQNKLIKAIND